MIYFINTQIFHGNCQNSYFFKISSRITRFLQRLISNIQIIFTASFGNMHHFKRRWNWSTDLFPIWHKIFSHFLRPIMQYTYFLMPNFRIGESLIFKTNWVKFSEKVWKITEYWKKLWKIVQNLKESRSSRNARCMWLHGDLSRLSVSIMCHL